MIKILQFFKNIDNFSIKIIKKICDAFAFYYRFM